MWSRILIRYAFLTHPPFSLIHATNSSSITSAMPSINFGKYSGWFWRTQSTERPAATANKAITCKRMFLHVRAIEGNRTQCAIYILWTMWCRRGRDLAKRWPTWRRPIPPFANRHHSNGTIVVRCPWIPSDAYVQVPRPPAKRHWTFVYWISSRYLYRKHKDHIRSWVRERLLVQHAPTVCQWYYVFAAMLIVCWRHPIASSDTECIGRRDICLV